MHGIQWIQKLLMTTDADAASRLASYLIYDENLSIAGMAKIILDNTIANSSPIVLKENFFVSIIDLKKSEGLTIVQSDVKNQSRVLAKKLQISCEESMVLLLHFKFLVTRAEFEYRNNPVAC